MNKSYLCDVNKKSRNEYEKENLNWSNDVLDGTECSGTVSV